MLSFRFLDFACDTGITRDAAAAFHLQNRSTQGRSSISHDQALCGWWIRCM